MELENEAISTAESGSSDSNKRQARIVLLMSLLVLQSQLRNTRVKQKTPQDTLQRNVSNVDGITDDEAVKAAKRFVMGKLMSSTCLKVYRIIIKSSGSCCLLMISCN